MTDTFLEVGDLTHDMLVFLDENLQMPRWYSALDFISETAIHAFDVREFLLTALRIVIRQELGGGFPRCTRGLV